MPGMGGLAACREMRADPNVAIIMLTVHNTEAAKVKRWTRVQTTS